MLNSVEPHVTRPSEDQVFIVRHKNLVVAKQPHLLMLEKLKKARSIDLLCACRCCLYTCIVADGGKYCSVEGWLVLCPMMYEKEEYLVLRRVPAFPHYIKEQKMSHI